MIEKVTVFLPFMNLEIKERIIGELRNPLIKNIFFLSPGSYSLEEPHILKVQGFYSVETMKLILQKSETEYILMVTSTDLIFINQFGIERFLRIADDTYAGILYSDYYEISRAKQIPHPLIDFQPGSVRDDFDFGKLLFIRTSSFRQALEDRIEIPFLFAGLYDIRLNISIHHKIFRVAEFLYSIQLEQTNTETTQFEYVNPRNRNVQIEMETAFTEYLKKIGAYLHPVFQSIDVSRDQFDFEASVIIPVKNRVKTIKDAIESVLIQKTNYRYNLIIVDNHSNDGTTELIKSIAEIDNRVIHIIPKSETLGIGGCWNEAVHHPNCGRFSIQLDSDDVYKDETTLNQIIEVFRKTNCAMVIGSYKLTNFKLEEIPPGIIDHREWTWHNGRNNALRINGLGAPRAFFTPILRQIKIPNVSYGEDYAMGLAISREYMIGRIYEPIYLCRRWEENSDASPDINKLNSFNLYKDKLRTMEILARQKLIKSRQ